MTSISCIRCSHELQAADLCCPACNMVGPGAGNAPQPVVMSTMTWPVDGNGSDAET